MKKYYCIITQEQLNQLLSFGEIFLPEYLAVDFTEEIDFIQHSLVNSISSFIKFKYDELVLVIECSAYFDIQNHSLKIQITDIEKIFPISEEGNRALAFKYPKINFSAPIFTIESLSKINNTYFLNDIKKGISSLKSIFDNLFQENDSVNEEEIIQAALKFREGMRLSMLPNDSNIIDFTFLYVYQEHYPLNTLGYFFRTAEILIRKKTLESGKKSEDSIDLFKKSDIFNFLEGLRSDNKDYKVPDIDILLNRNTSAKIKNFIETLTILGVKYYIIIPIFLKVIDEFNSNNQNLGKTLLEHLRGSSYIKEYPRECQQLIIWLGAYLGYGNCYDYFHLKNNLKIFKSYKSQVINHSDKNQIANESFSKIDNDKVELTEIIVENNTIIENTVDINEELPIITHLLGENCIKVDNIKWQENFLRLVKEKKISDNQCKQVDVLIREYINSKVPIMYEEALNENDVLRELLAKFKVSLKNVQKIKLESVINEIQLLLPINEIFDEIQKRRDKASNQNE